MNTETANNDPNRFFWYGVFMVITIVSALPLFGARLSNLDINYLLLIYSRICSISFLWAHFLFKYLAMQIRFNQSKEAGSGQEDSLESLQ